MSMSALLELMIAIRMLFAMTLKAASTVIVILGTFTLEMERHAPVRTLMSFI